MSQERWAPKVVSLTLVVGVLGAAASTTCSRVVPSPEPETPPDALDLVEVAPVSSPVVQLAWLAPESQGTDWGALEAAPPDALGALAPRGRALYERLCAACHGEGGRGDGPLAADLPRRPRDLARAPLRTRLASGDVTAGEVFRSITAGAALYGMPSFAHLPQTDRWALAASVLDLRERALPPEPLALPPAPAAPDLALGRRVFAETCAPCHGEGGAGDGPAAATLVDVAGRPCPPANFTRGPDALRGGARARDIVRTILLGRPGTPMVSQALSAEEAWSVAAWVARLTEQGLLRRRQEWNAYFRARGEPTDVPGAEVLPTEDRWPGERPPEPTKGRAGCLGCHEGVEPIASGPMARALAALAGADPDRECALCHEGDPGARAQEAAHTNMIGNPGSLWVTSLGLGCGKCHSNRGALTSLMARPFPEPRGGGLLAITSKQTDPTGASGSDHAYRMQRALMAQETGKVLLLTGSVGLTPPTEHRFTAFPLDDPDGAVPTAGGRTYKGFIARALERGALRRAERTAGLPTYEEALELTGRTVVAGYVDYYRKACARCHLWGEGKAADRQYRSSGCSACHVLNDNLARSESGDPTIPKGVSGHALRHQIVMAIPEGQCNHCHTRGHFTKFSEPHQQAGIECVDCHTSIDVHGDGNIYPSIDHQLEIRCEDCHGTTDQLPWELPVGHGTQAQAPSPRGTLPLDDKTYMLTSRGNARANWIIEDSVPVVVSLASGARHRIPLLARRAAAPPTPEVPESPGAHGAGCSYAEPGHKALACAACHNRRAPRCMPCHLTYVRTDSSQDYILSALFHDPQTGRQANLHTPGDGGAHAMSDGSTSMTWGEPEPRKDTRGRIVPRIPGCDVTFTFVSEAGKVEEFRPLMNPRTKSYPPPVGPGVPHENAVPVRACASCHPAGVGKGPAKLPGLPK